MLALSIVSFKLARVDLLDETNSKARSIFAYFSVRSSCSCRLILTKCYHEWILNLNKFLGIRNLNPVFFFCFFFVLFLFLFFVFFWKKNRWPESCFFFFFEKTRLLHSTQVLSIFCCREGVESPAEFSKRGGLTGPQLLEEGRGGGLQLSQKKN